jgi:hypothetical protein
VPAVLSSLLQQNPSTVTGVLLLPWGLPHCDQLIDGAMAFKCPPSHEIFTVISLTVNIVVLVAVCTVLVAFPDAEPVVFTWGPPTAGRGILLSVYFSILALSVILVVLNKRCADKAPVQHMVAALLAAQILYKVTTPATAGATNPVALSNLAISVVHAYTLYTLWQHHSRRPSQ